MDAQRAARRARLAHLVASTGSSAEMSPRRAAVATLAAASVAAPAQARTVPVMPAPPHVTYAQGLPPNMPDADMALGAASAYDPNTQTIYSDGGLDRYARGHEVGHAFDQEVLTSADRLRFEQVMGIGKGRWDQGTGAAGGSTSPNEWFADYYSAAVNHMDPRREGFVGYADIGPRRLAGFTRLLAQIGQRQHLQPYQR